MNWQNTLQNVFSKNQTAKASSQLAQQNTQGAAGGGASSPTYVTTTTTGLSGNYYQQMYGGVLGQQYQLPYAPPWPTMTLSLKDVALLHRICGDDEEVRAVLNKILPHFKLEA